MLASPPPLHLWYSRCQVPTAFGFALYRGLFAEEFPAGGRVVLQALQDAGDPAVAQSHFTHSQPFSMRHGSCYPALWAQAHGARTRIVGISTPRASQTVLALPGSGITRPADLRGRRLLVVKRPSEPIDYLYATTLKIYETALASAGLGWGDVELVEHTVGRPFTEDRITQTYAKGGFSTQRAGRTGLWQDSVFPLLRGEVDAITSGGSIGVPSLQLQLMLGLEAVFEMASVTDDVLRSNNSTPLVFAVSEDLLEQRPDVALRVLSRVLQAAGLATRHPGDAVRCIAHEQSGAEALAQQAWGHGITNTFDITITPAKVRALKSQETFLRQLGATEREVDVDRWIAPEWLERTRLETTTTT